MQVPVFLSLNLFDAWLTGEEEKCCGPFGGVSKVGPTRADPHFDYLVSVVAPAVRAVVHNATDKNYANPAAQTRNGAFVPGCIDHSMQWNEKSAPVLGECNHAAAVASWFFGLVNGGHDWQGNKVPKCDPVLLSHAQTIPELAKLHCNKGSLNTK